MSGDLAGFALGMLILAVLLRWMGRHPGGVEPLLIALGNAIALMGAALLVLAAVLVLA